MACSMSSSLYYYHYRLPLRVPFRTARYTFRYREGIIIGDGGCIWAEASPLPGFSTETFEEVLDYLQMEHPLILDHFLSEKLDGFIASHPPGSGRIIPPSLRFALSMLSEQQKALKANLPLWDYWYREHSARFLPSRTSAAPSQNNDTVVCCNGIIGSAEQPRIKDKISQLREDGFRTIKIKLPPDIDKSYEVIATICLYFNDIKFRFDANQGFSFDQADRLFSRLSRAIVAGMIPGNLEYVEEPVRSGEIERLAELRQYGIKIAADESVRTAADIRSHLDSGSIDAVVVKPMMAGSFSDLLEMFECCIPSGSTAVKKTEITEPACSVILSSALESSTGRLLLAHLASFLDQFVPQCHGLATAELFDRDILLSPIRKVLPSSILLPSQPGLGQKPTSELPTHSLHHKSASDLPPTSLHHKPARDLPLHGLRHKPASDPSSPGSLPLTEPEVPTVAMADTGFLTLPEPEELSDHLFLTDGRRKIRYGDFGRLLERFRKLVREININKETWLAVDTTHRFEAVIGMILCWMERVPFHPFSLEQPGIIDIFQPAAVISSSEETASQLRTSGQSGIPIVSTMSEYEFSGEVKTAGRQHTTGFDPRLLYSETDGLFCGLLTSGSSGQPKKVVLHRSQMIAASFHAERRYTMAETGVKQLCLNSKNAVWSSFSSSGDSLWGHCLPLDHIGGISILFRALLSGKGVYLWDGFNPARILQDLCREENRIRRLSFVPTMLKRIIDKHETIRKRRVPPLPGNLIGVLVGGGPDPSGQVKRARTAGWPAVYSYGLTETCGQVAAQKLDGSSPDGSVGPLFPGHELRITDDAGKMLSPGKTGLIHLAGPQISSATVNPEQRWFQTGDYGRIDESGNLFITVKRTDLIVTGGKNVRPQEIESLLASLPGIVDAGVTGLPDKEWGQRVVALIVPVDRKNPPVANQVPSSQSGLITEKTVMSALKKKLKPHQCPKEILIVDSIPRSSLGKIRREALRSMAQSHTLL